MDRTSAITAGTSTPADDIERFQQVRARSTTLCEGLHPEDLVVQSMPDASPVKWHLAHTTWFFETFVLKSHLAGYVSPEPAYGHLFNSYYNQIGKPFFRPRRGVISRPTVEETLEYRRRVDECMLDLLADSSRKDRAEIAEVTEVGLHHEEQHQELILTDLKHAFSLNPLWPAYRPDLEPGAQGEIVPFAWHQVEGGVGEIGHHGGSFAFDNERPRHRVLCEPYSIATRLVTAGEYLTFLEDGGYERPELWLSDGWDTVQAQGWDAPLYWTRDSGSWYQFTLGGPRPVAHAEPICHVSFYEADAYARWAGCRLPTEAEWEAVAAALPVEGNLLESGSFHPRALMQPPGSSPDQLFGDVWEWTASPYTAYPGYAPPAGALGEYNGKFMSNRFVLRGGSCATPRLHIRATYRNFFAGDARWQFAGIRLAKGI